MLDTPNSPDKMPPPPATDGWFKVNVSMVEVEDDDLAIIAATSTNYYTSYLYHLHRHGNNVLYVRKLI